MVNSCRLTYEFASLYEEMTSDPTRGRAAESTSVLMFLLRYRGEPKARQVATNALKPATARRRSSSCWSPSSLGTALSWRCDSVRPPARRTARSRVSSARTGSALKQALAKAQDPEEATSRVTGG